MAAHADTFSAVTSIHSLLIACWHAALRQRALSIEKLTHGYQDRMLFDNTSLEIEKGERVAVIGASLSSCVRWQPAPSCLWCPASSSEPRLSAANGVPCTCL